MKLVLDNNILFSIMNLESTSAYLFSSVRAEFFAPEFIRKELSEHEKECLIKSELSDEQFEMRRAEVDRFIKFFKLSEYKEYLEESAKLISDPDDVDFLALALLTNSSIWSNDLHLKEQSLVKVFTTKELLEMFLCDNI